MRIAAGVYCGLARRATKGDGAGPRSVRRFTYSQIPALNGAAARLVAAQRFHQASSLNIPQIECHADLLQLQAAGQRGRTTL